MSLAVRFINGDIARGISRLNISPNLSATRMISSPAANCIPVGLLGSSLEKHEHHEEVMATPIPLTPRLQSFHLPYLQDLIVSSSSNVFPRWAERRASYRP